MTLRFFLLSFFVVVSLNAVAQDEDYARDSGQEKSNSFSFDKVQFGGGASLQLGTQTLVEISPRAILPLSDRFYMGAGVRGIFYRIDMNRIYGYGGISQSFIYGGSTFLDFLITESIVAHGEFEALNFSYYDDLTQEMDRKWISGLFAGGGYRQYFNDGRSFVEFLLLYNFNFSPLSPYSSPFLPRISVYF